MDFIYLCLTQLQLIYIVLSRKKKKSGSLADFFDMCLGSICSEYILHQFVEYSTYQYGLNSTFTDVSLRIE